MYNYNQPYPRYNSTARAGLRGTVMGQVLGLLGFSFVFTALGAWLGVHLGPGAFFPALIASFGALLALFFLRERSPLNLALLYTFATGEGITLGLLLQSYVAHGLGDRAPSFPG